MKKIIILGASSGLGRLMAEEFARKGTRLGLAARNEKALAEIKEKYPDRVTIKAIDITREDAPALLKQLIEETGGADVYVHASGICHENPKVDLRLDELTVKTNVEGFARMIDTVFNYFKENKRAGRIAAITSIAGTKGIGDLTSYAASKRFQWNYLEGLEQLARREKIAVRFTDIRPGWTRTPLINPERRYMMSMGAAKVAHAAVKAVVKGKRVIYIDHRWRLMGFLWKIFPSKLWVRLGIRASKEA